MKRYLRPILWLVPILASLLAVISVAGVRDIEQSWPPVGRYVDVDGYRLHYTDHGSGPAVVLIHGASSSLLEFQVSLVPALSQDFRVIAFDRPGHGYSVGNGDGWTDPAALADLLLRASEALGAERPVLVGHSWAGSVVMSALVREPGRVAGGVLLAGAVGHWVGEEDLVERLRDWPLLNALFARTLVYPVGSQLIPRALTAVFAPHPVPDGHAARIGAALALRPRSYLANAEDMNRLADFLQSESTRYRSIDRPLLVIHGTDDELVPFWNHGDRLRPVVSGLEVSLMEGLGHALHHVDTEGVSNAIRRFVNVRVGAGDHGSSRGESG
jgi:pimeloyl-ACP methyl ester carboxylesterase